MIAVDTSVVVAIALEEADAAAFIRVLTIADAATISAASVVEAHIVLGRRTPPLSNKVDAILTRFGIAVRTLDREQTALARDAFDRFGKGRHPATLNFGDCFAYALAASLNAPLLYKGDDFARTDIEAALV